MKVLPNHISSQTRLRWRGNSVWGLKYLGICGSLLLCLAFSIPYAWQSKGRESAALRKAKNDNALLRAQQNIEKFRKGDVRIRVIDQKGKPVKNARISIRQTAHDFKFGCYLKIDDLAPEKLPQYERQFARLFNYAVVGTYWSFVENEQGKADWTWFDRETTLAKKLNLRIEAAPVLWGTSEFGTPGWLPAKTEELAPILKNRIESTVTKNAGQIEDWEIVNEPLAPAVDLFARRAGSEYIAEAFAEAHRRAPSNRLMINEYGVFGAHPKRNYNREKYYQMVKTLLENRVPIDVVGIQAHANGEWFEPAAVAAELERYAALGKPLQITEFSAQTSDYDDRTTPLAIAGDYRSGDWNDARQAEFFREFYTIAFGNPQVEAITAWGLDEERAWLPGIGLVDADGNPKQNYQMLDKLINKEWQTNLQTNSSAGGSAQFRGFYGNYEIEVALPSQKKTTAKFVLLKNADNEWTIKL